MKKMNKKGQPMLTWVMKAALILALLAVGFFFINKFILKPSDTFSKTNLMAQQNLCEFDGKRLKNYVDLDKDKIPDICDICVGGNNYEDDDVDGMPNACDPDDRNEPDKKTKMKDLCTDSGGVWDEQSKKPRCFTSNELYEGYYSG